MFNIKFLFWRGRGSTGKFCFLYPPSPYRGWGGYRKEHHGGPYFWSIFCFCENCLNSLLENSPPLLLCIIYGLWCVVKHFFNTLISVADFLSIIHFAHVYLEMWSTIVNKYVYGLVHNTLVNCTKSIWHLSKGLELRMWWTISSFLSFPELTCHIWHLNQKFLTSP